MRRFLAGLAITLGIALGSTPQAHGYAWVVNASSGQIHTQADGWISHMRESMSPGAIYVRVIAGSNAYYDAATRTVYWGWNAATSWNQQNFVHEVGHDFATREMSAGEWMSFRAWFSLPWSENEQVYHSQARPSVWPVHEYFADWYAGCMLGGSTWVQYSPSEVQMRYGASAVSPSPMAAPNPTPWRGIWPSWLAVDRCNYIPALLYNQRTAAEGDSH